MDNVVWLVAGFVLVAIIVVGWIGVRTRKSAIVSAEIGRQLLLSNNDILTQTSKSSFDTARSLKAIHTLVNSNLAEAKKRELDATRATLKSMREVVTLKEGQDIVVSVSTRATIDQLEERIAELLLAQAHTQEQTAIADREADE